MYYHKIFDTPFATPSDSGKEVYGWDYLNDDGKLVSDKKDMYAYIQSFKKMTEYKEMIDENGNIDLLGATNGGVFADVSPIQNSGTDIDSYIATLAQTLKEALANQQREKAKKINEPVAKTADEGKQIDEKGGKQE